MSTFALQKNAKYRAKIQVPFFKRPFASCDAIKTLLEGAGFADVAVTGGDGGAYAATGIWPKLDESVALPDGVTVEDISQ